MFRLTAGFLSLLMLLPAVAAAQGEPLPNPIQVPGAPWYFDSFIVDVPNEDGWASFSKDPKSAELGKKYEDGHTAAAVVEAHMLAQPVVGQQDLLAVVKQINGTSPDPAAKLADYQAELITPKGLLCARSLARFDDTGSGEKPDRPGILLVRGLTCVRPDRPEIIVGLRFGERAQPGAPAPHPDDVGERFLRSLRFTPISFDLINQARSAVGMKNGEEAVRLLQPAAEQGDGEAALFLGNILLYGSGIAEDLPGARKWLEVAARQGRVDAIYNVGAIYDKGIGTPRDAGEAIKWFTLAADQRDPTSQLNLALFYLRGDGVEKSLATAELWLKRSANNGNKRAQGILTSGTYKKQ
jgi:hypothetical protein